MRVIIVDDEPIAIDILKIMLSEYENIDIVGTYTKPLEAIKEVKNTKPDLIFLDIEMGEMNGLEAANYFIKELDKVEIVFSTAYMEYAVEAFEINALDYLLKPIQKKRLTKTLERVNRNINQKNKAKEQFIEVQGFKEFIVKDSQGNNISWRTKKTKEIFAHLWLNQRESVSKSRIMEDVFPGKDTEKATTMLHTTIYQLRKVLRNLGYVDSITFKNNAYQLNVPIVSDVDELYKIYYDKEYKEEDVKTTLELYRGSLLGNEGYYWALELEELYNKMVISILNTYVEEQLYRGLSTPILKMCLDTIYEIDRYNENTIRLYINYYGMQNDIIGLVNFFKKYKNKIWKEIRSKPSKKTLDLYESYTKKQSL